MRDNISAARGKAINQLNRFNYDGGYKDVKYNKSKDGSIFSAETDNYKLTMENGQLSHYEDSNGIVSSRKNEDGSIEYFYQGNDGVSEHQHYKFDEQNNPVEHFTDINNNGNFESKVFKNYDESGIITSERAIFDNKDDGSINSDTITNFYKDGRTPQNQTSSFYENGQISSSIKKEYDENGKITSSISTTYDSDGLIINEIDNLE